MKLALFDIDGTLIHTGGAGKRAFSQAMEDILGVPDALSQVRLDGKTDLLILEEALTHSGRSEPVTPVQLDALYQCYVGLLEQELQADLASYLILPGVEELLDRLHGEGGVAVGLATGNLELGARVKLAPGNLNRYFNFGGFGSDAASRTELIQAGIRRAAEAHGVEEFDSVVVLGDTPQDILHGKAAGARVVAVATGFYSRAQLAEFAPDLLVDRFDPVEPVLRFIHNGGAA